MPITPMFTRDDIRERFDNFLKAVEEESIKALTDMGERCVIEARNNHAYIDQTGNLTSSIAYMIFKNGEAIHENFEQVKEGAEGIKAGKELAQKIGSEYPERLVLIVVAGMNYAIYVEAKGLNVLASAEHLAEKELPRMMEELINDIKKAN